MALDEIYWGASIVPIVFVEVIPLRSKDNDNDNDNDSSYFGGVDLSNVFVKAFLRKLSRKYHLILSLEDGQEGIQIEWTAADSTQRLYSGYLSQTRGGTSQQQRVFLDHQEADQQESIPVFYLPSNDPTEFDPIACVVKAYGSPIQGMDGLAEKALITSSTLVRILPPRPSSLKDSLFHQSIDALQHLSGEAGLDFLTPDLQEEVLANHNHETVQALSLRMSMQCSRDIYIGTTTDALTLHRQCLLRNQRMQQVIEARLGVSSSSTTPRLGPDSAPRSASSRSIPWEASLLVHSPNHADGKTLLVQAVAKTIGCSRIHILRSGPLLAKYGIHADSALESMMHGILVSAAVQSQPVCIILDHLDTMMPPQLSGRSGAGDAAIPVFNAISSYLRKITTSMERSQEFPFPIKNAMYNVGASGGRVLLARCCLVAIVTCPDDGWRSLQQGSYGVVAATQTTILDSLQGGRYRLPSLDAETRWNAFARALQRANLVLEDGATTTKRLAVLAASAGWAKAGAFQRVAATLQRQRDGSSSSSSSSLFVSTLDLDRAFTTVQAIYAEFADVSFQSALGTQDGQSKDLFASVGGNLRAKECLEDALALEPRKRQMLARFGLSTPTGILLYGPPGVGKTLLAKALVQLLKSPAANDSSIPMGGTFISLSSSDLVRAEIGASEKMLVSAFEFADKNAPSVIFLDEFQALFTERSRGGSGKLASTLLQCLDDVKRWSAINESSENGSQSSTTTTTIGNRVVVLGATNTPWMVDSAFLRTGRFDRVVHVGLPSLTERASILQVHMSRMKIKYLESYDSLQGLCQSTADRTEGFSGADLAALCRAAAIRALSDAGDDCWVEERHFLKALEMDVRASSDARLVERLLKWKP